MKAKQLVALASSLLLMLGAFSGCGTSTTNERSRTNPSDTSTTLTTSTTASSPVEAITTTEPKLLSNDCNMILCTGYSQGDCYELVATQIDKYPSSTFQFGVIKNNKWLVALSKKCPFLDDEGWWKGIDKSYQSNSISQDDFQHIGDSVFLYKGSIMYNPETGVYFENLCNRDYSQLNNVVEFVGFESYHEEGTANNYIYFKCFNTQTGNEKEIKGYFENARRPDKLYDISDGLFFASYFSPFVNEYNYSGFFDLNGNMVLDLTKYNITDYHNYIFENGKYTITCTNDSSVKFDITFDTTGKIISQTKSE